MKQWLIIGAVFTALLVFAGFQQNAIENLKQERNRYKRNTETLLSDVQTYKVRDSLNAAKVQLLELTQKEFEKYRADDAALIRELKAKNQDLAAVNTTQTQTIIALQSIPKDTVIIRDFVQVPAMSVACGDEWFDFVGIITRDEFTGTLTNRESLVLSETIQYKRFLFWKTKKILNKETAIVSRNPHTTIINVESIIIED